jgi:hypothetical protein
MKLVLMVVFAAAFGAVAGCSAEEGEQDRMAAALQGVWNCCHGDGGGDLAHRITVANGRLVERFVGHSTTDGTCSGQELSATGESGPFTLGAAIPATLGAEGITVTAYELDVVLGGGTLHTIAFVAWRGQDRLLFIGALDAARDGTAPAARPVVLDAAYPLVRERRERPEPEKRNPNPNP